MSKLIWDAEGTRLYETGVKQGALYVKGENGYTGGVVWNGLTAVTESPSGAEATALYADDIKYLNLISAEEFGATIEAYGYPKEFGPCNGEAAIEGLSFGQQTRKTFGLCYKTVIGNDSESNDHGYKLHFIYGAKAAPSERAYATINDSPEAITFSWELTTTPVDVAGKKKTALLTIDSTKFTESAKLAKLKNLEAILYGADDFSATKTYAIGDYVVNDGELYICKTAVTTAGTFNSSSWTKIGTSGPRLPLPDEVKTLLS